jgi:plastocyanin
MTTLPLTSVALAAVVAGTASVTVHADEWRVLVGSETHGRGSQALAFLPNEIWIHAGDSIRWIFPTHERHTMTLLRPGQTRPPGFGPVFGVIVGCPGVSPNGSSYDGSACVTSDVLMLDENAVAEDPPTYSVTFPTVGNFKVVCLIHADMTGVVHVVNPAAALPHDADFYAHEADRQRAAMLADASGLAKRSALPDADDGGSAHVAAGIGAVVTMTGAGSETASLMRFERRIIVVNVGDTVEWANLDPSINHTVTFGAEPADPRPPSANVSLTSDGARLAVIGSVGDTVNSGFLTPAPQDRANLPQAAPGVTHFRVTFTSAGTYNYICAVHDQLGMKGTVIVQ